MAYLLPDIPEEIRAARLGSCFDSIKRELIQTKNAIDLNRLDQNAILMVTGTGTLKLTADASTSKGASGSFYALDSKAKIGSWASMSYNMELANSDASTAHTLNCYCSYVYSGQSLKLMDVGSDKLFNYMTDEFQTMFTEMINAADPAEFLEKYMDFQNVFGYGCVTELRLTSGSAFRMTAQYNDSASANKSKYGGSIAIGGFWGGGAVASNFAKEAKKADGNAKLELVAEQIPLDTPTKEWCNTLMKDLLQRGLTELTKDTSFISAYEGKPPAVPEIPAGKPSEKKVPKNEKQNDITKEQQKALMKEDGFRGTWEQYVEAQKKAYEKIKPNEVVKDVNNNIDSFLAMKTEQDTTSHTARAATSSFGSGWNLGGYVPYNYVVTPWTKLFEKQMKGLALPTTFTSIYIAKAYIYYLTRMQFANYLYFLSDVGRDLAENDNIELDADIFAKACSDLLKDIGVRIRRVLQSSVFTEEQYNYVVTGFEKRVNNLYGFCSQKTYWYFFNNYDFFMDMACGGVQVYFYPRRDPQYYKHDIGLSRIPQPFITANMLRDAVRDYQVLTPGGSLKSVVFNTSRNRFYPDQNILRGLRGIRIPDITNNSSYYACEIYGDETECRLYTAGYKDLALLNNTSIIGRPMISSFDFDSIMRFADPSGQF